MKARLGICFLYQSASISW